MPIQWAFIQYKMLLFDFRYLIIFITRNDEVESSSLFSSSTLETAWLLGFTDFIEILVCLKNKLFYEMESDPIGV